MPLIVTRNFFGVNATASTVFNPASASFFMSLGWIPASWSLLTRSGPVCIYSSVSSPSLCWDCEGWDIVGIKKWQTDGGTNATHNILNNIAGWHHVGVLDGAEESYIFVDGRAQAATDSV